MWHNGKKRHKEETKLRNKGESTRPHKTEIYNREHKEESWEPEKAKERRGEKERTLCRNIISVARRSDFICETPPKTRFWSRWITTGILLIGAYITFNCYHSVQNLFSSRLLSKNIKIRIYKTIILPAILYGCETMSRTLRQEHRHGVWEQCVEENIWTKEGWRDRRLEKTA
jgi:hypothetical protein